MGMLRSSLHMDRSLRACSGLTPNEGPACSRHRHSERRMAVVVAIRFSFCALWQHLSPGCACPAPIRNGPHGIRELTASPHDTSTAATWSVNVSINSPAKWRYLRPLTDIAYNAKCFLVVSLIKLFCFLEVCISVRYLYQRGVNQVGVILMSLNWFSGFGCSGLCIIDREHHRKWGLNWFYLICFLNMYREEEHRFNSSFSVLALCFPTIDGIIYASTYIDNSLQYAMTSVSLHNCPINK